MELVRKVKELIAFGQAGNWSAVVKLTLEIIGIITMGWEDLPQPQMATMAGDADLKKAFSTSTKQTAAGLFAELECWCEEQEAAPSEAMAAGGAFGGMLLPILTALLKEALKKLIGF